MTDETFGSIVRANSYDTLEQTTDAVIAALKLNVRQRSVLAPVIRNAVRIEYRCTARLIEPRPTEANDRRTVHPAAERAAYLHSRFKGRDKWVTWGEATVDDHAAHVDMLRRLQEGINSTIVAHQQAIDAILAADVGCLNDLPEVPAGLEAIA